MAYAKRVAPLDVEPVIYNGLKYSAPHWGMENDATQNGGYILISNIKTESEVWRGQIYKTKDFNNIETDVEDVFITSLVLNKNEETLLIKTENGDVFKFFINTREVLRL